MDFNVEIFLCYSIDIILLFTPFLLVELINNNHDKHNVPIDDPFNLYNISAILMVVAIFFTVLEIIATICDYRY